MRKYAMPSTIIKCDKHQVIMSNFWVPDVYKYYCTDIKDYGLPLLLPIETKVTMKILNTFYLAMHVNFVFCSISHDSKNNLNADHTEPLP